MLKMKAKCERCKIDFPQNELAYICSYECTFCDDCTAEMDNTCPNCDGELMKRPTRVRGVVDVATSQIKRKFTGAK